MTLSCSDLRWNELIAIICKLKEIELSEEEIAEMTYFERCELLDSNPVLLARHFQKKRNCDELATRETEISCYQN